MRKALAFFIPVLAGCSLLVLQMSVSAQTVGWCSSNGGDVERLAGCVNGSCVTVHCDEQYDNMSFFDGGRNGAQQCWDAALFYLSEDFTWREATYGDHGDNPQEVCDYYHSQGIFPYNVD